MKRISVFVAGLLSCVMAVPGPADSLCADEFTAVEHQRQTIYHSPQTPGFTSWVGA